MTITLLGLSLDVMNAAEPAAKMRAAQRVVNVLGDGAPIGDDRQPAPTRPQRPEKPILCPPSEMPRRRFGSVKGRATLLHAIAHIELNAIDLAFDMAVRFTKTATALGLDAQAFVADWISVGGDEARHFGLIETRLAELGFKYGDFPAHDGLWEAAENTAGEFLARLVVAPLILEARGLDVTPGMIVRLRDEGDAESAAILEVIYNDEIGHVACGERWFSAACSALDYEPVQAFQRLKAEFFAGALKPPFNHEGRDLAGMPRSYYDPI